MENVLTERTQEWMNLERATLKQRMIADEFYEKKLMRPIVSEFLMNNKEAVREEVEGMILTVGTSYEPLVLSIQLFKPKRILFLYTPNTERFIDKVIKFCRLKNSTYDKRMVREGEPLDVYREIKTAYLAWNRPEKIYIDLTGGTKAMSSAAAMAGALIDVQLVYVGTNDYLIDFRKPKPGSERIQYIGNPYEVFGDLEIEKAITLLKRYNYAGARERLELLKERVPDPVIRQQLNFIYLLTCVYEHWDALEFQQAHACMERLLAELYRDSKLHHQFIMMDYIPGLMKQKKILDQLVKIPAAIKGYTRMETLKDKEKIVALMFTLYSNALIREEQEKYDFSTLLLYRLLEMIEQRRLALYNVDVSRVEYFHIEYPERLFEGKNALTDKEKFEIYRGKIMEIKKMLFRRSVNDFLPEQISLLEGFIQLAALGDKIVAGTKVIDKIKRIRAMTFLRNNSIYAHGFTPVSRVDFLKFKNFVTGLFQEFCKIERINYKEYLDDIAWIDPSESKYSLIRKGA